MNVQYVVDEKGSHTAVQVPIGEWRAQQRKLKKLQQLTQIRKDLKEAFKEMDEIRRGKRKGTTLREFLNEL
jgi:hypothetical protein